jgi:alpha-glucosidase (family GH31 glycosyl hydrolase)
MTITTATALRSSSGDSDRQYLWGRDLLVAPVVEKGARNRRVYLPRGVWFDFWTEERVEGGREIERRVDLQTMPLYVRAGAVIPLDPIRQYSSEPVDAPTTLIVSIRAQVDRRSGTTTMGSRSNTSGAPSCVRRCAGRTPLELSTCRSLRSRG